MKIKNSYLVLVLVLGSFFFTWHYRASLIGIAKAASQTHHALAQVCD